MEPKTQRLVTEATLATVVGDAAEETVKSNIKAVTVRGAAGHHPTASKPLDAPIFSKAHSAARSILWPSVVDNSRGGGTGWSMFYSTDHEVHANSGLFRATAPTPLEVFTDTGLVYRDDAGGVQTETPSVVWDDRAGEWIMYYQQAGATGGLGVQSTLYCTSKDLVTWTRQGLCAGMRETSDVGDGHTGYFKPFDLHGAHYAYSMYGSSNLGAFGLWRSLDRRTWTVNPHQIGAQGAIMPLEHSGIVGEPMDTPAEPPTGTTTPWYPKMFIGDVLLWHGRPWWVGLVGPRSAGGGTRPQRLMTAPLRDDLLGLAETPVDITPPAQAWETEGGIEQLGNLFAYQGRTFIVYRAAGLGGHFGIMEIH